MIWAEAIRAGGARGFGPRDDAVLYHVYEFQHAAATPLRTAAEWTNLLLTNPLNPFAYTAAGRTVAAACEVFESTTRRYGKPAFGLRETSAGGVPVPVREETLWRRPFGALKHFARDPRALAEAGVRAPQPPVLIVAPLSGHYATLLRGTVEAMLPGHEVAITDWTDARDVPLAMGTFDLSDYIDYVIEMLRVLHARHGRAAHAMAVCQPGPAVLAAAALMAADGDPAAPLSLTIMGSPIDARRSPTVPNKLAEEKTLRWFEKNMITNVPAPHAGMMRRVYPGFLQLTSFITMNRDRHIDAHRQHFRNLITGDGDSAARHRAFYDEYLAVMDLTADFYLETIDKVFQRHVLAKGELTHRGRRVRPEAIRRMHLLTVEGELDDISGIGQTQAAHDLCSGLPAKLKRDYVQEGVGHYGVFNGRRWREEIQPRVADMIAAAETAAR